MTPIAIRRRQKAKGRWMKLRDKQLLRNYLEHRDMSQARLARYAEVSRQFISQLLSEEDWGKNTCTPQVAQRIEEALGLIPGTLFDRLAPITHGWANGTRVGRCGWTMTATKQHGTYRQTTGSH